MSEQPTEVCSINGCEHVGDLFCCLNCDAPRCLEHTDAGICDHCTDCPTCDGAGWIRQSKAEELSTFEMAIEALRGLISHNYACVNMELKRGLRQLDPAIGECPDDGTGHWEDTGERTVTISFKKGEV